jgi:hypothetical protein
MEITLIYIVSLASAACAVLFWGCYRRVDIRTRVRILLYIRKGLLYTLAYRRRLSSDDVTVFSLLKISSLVAANITACVLKLQDSNELGKRCGSLFLANMIPLFFGGRRGFMNDQILRTQTSEQALVHRWMGRICVTQGIIHGIISIGHHSPSIPHIIVSLCPQALNRAPLTKSHVSPCPFSALWDFFPYFMFVNIFLRSF